MGINQFGKAVNTITHTDRFRKEKYRLFSDSSNMVSGVFIFVFGLYHKYTGMYTIL